MRIISRKEKARFYSPYFYFSQKRAETIDGNFFIISFLQPAAWKSDRNLLINSSSWLKLLGNPWTNVLSAWRLCHYWLIKTFKVSHSCYFSSLSVCGVVPNSAQNQFFSIYCCFLVTLFPKHKTHSLKDFFSPQAKKFHHIHT